MTGYVEITAYSMELTGFNTDLQEIIHELNIEYRGPATMV